MGEITEKISELENQILELKEEKEKTKKFKLPFRTKVRTGKAKKNYCVVWKINENSLITPEMHEIKEQTVVVDGVPRLATGEHVLKIKMGFKTYPLIIQPSWSDTPFCPKHDMKDSLEDGRNIKGKQLLLARMKSDALDSKKKNVPSWILWIIGLIVVGVGGYLLMTGKI